MALQFIERALPEVEDNAFVIAIIPHDFGTRCLSESHHALLQTGIAWQDAGQGGHALRHSCRHEHKLSNWGWVAHDGRSYGLQRIGDAELGLVRTEARGIRSFRTKACLSARNFYSIPKM